MKCDIDVNAVGCNGWQWLETECRERGKWRRNSCCSAAEDVAVHLIFCSSCPAWQRLHVYLYVPRLVMDSVASDWFWFWLPLLVVVVVVRALAVPSSLLVSWSWLTSLSHHSSLNT